ncbi:MAG: lysophospholipase [Coriobacteriales bacterium]|jgi:alpha-beta hydrolase superfamily lysophospholipase|nr:lysophospholipase [Coriobacteriales bacterium]
MFRKAVATVLVSALAFSMASCLGSGSFGALDSDSRQPDQELGDVRAAGLFELATTLTKLMQIGDESAALAMMGDEMRKAMEGKVVEVWASVAKLAGTFIGPGNYIGFRSDGYEILEHTLMFERKTYIQRTVFSADDLVVGLFFREGEVTRGSVPKVSTDDDLTSADLAGAQLPTGVTEEQVTVDAGVGLPLSGLLTLPSSTGSNTGASGVASDALLDEATGDDSASSRADAFRVAVLLVHGSGPQDMDETVGANKPFRDIAYALAEKGVAVLRYDKRTFAYGSVMTKDVDALAKLTIYEETIDDATAAVTLLKTRFSKVYVLGHSMAGGLLGEIAGADGYIIMNGTPRRLYELSAEQNMTYADELAQTGKEAEAEQIRVFVENELAKASRLSSMSDEEALSPDNAVFTISAWYLRSLEGIDSIAALLQAGVQDGKPVLVLQGGNDRQVPEADLELWRDGLSNHPNATFRLYPTLNHLMGEYVGEQVPFSELVQKEYAQPTPVATKVTDDIAAWIASL